MNAHAGIDRVVVLLGPADPTTTNALTAAGLTMATRIGDTTVWATGRPDGGEPPVGIEPPNGAARLLTVDQAAAALEVGRTTTRELIRTGQLEAVRVGRCVRVPADAVDELIGTLRRNRRVAKKMHPSPSQAGGTLKVLGGTDASQPSAASSDSLPHRRPPVEKAEPDARPEAS